MNTVIGHLVDGFHPTSIGMPEQFPLDGTIDSEFGGGEFPSETVSLVIHLLGPFSVCRGLAGAKELPSTIVG
jgi:hypothetical protein